MDEIRSGVPKWRRVATPRGRKTLAVLICEVAASIL